VYGEFGKTSVGPPWGKAARPQYHGSLLYKYEAQAPETMPDVRMAPVLKDLADLAEGTLMLAIGRGRYHADTKLAWYKECATTVGGGGDGTPPACCTTERDAGRYGPATSYASTPRHPGSTHRVGYGGEGTIAGCGLPGEITGTDPEAPLTYLGPVYDSNPSGTASWTLWEWSVESIVDHGKNADGNREYDSFPATRSNTSMSDAGRCWTATSKDENDWVMWAPPTNLMKGHAYCLTDGVSVPAGPPLHTVSASNGDSGLVLFAYLPQRTAGDRWTYVGQGVNGYWWTLGTTVYKWQFDKWVLGIDPAAASPSEPSGRLESGQRRLPWSGARYAIQGSEAQSDE
jgi:hypothetical protein